MNKSRLELWVTAIYWGVMTGSCTIVGLLVLGVVTRHASQPFVMAAAGCGFEVAVVVVATNVYGMSSRR